MPPSQLKRLKASLREQGITGPQKSKKQKKNSHGANADQRMQRQAALQGIRDSFNPFEIKAPSRPAKFETTTNKSMDGKAKLAAVGRPGVTKSMGEESRKRTLLPEMQRRNKIGGVLDRRIGESDPTMTPEEKALQRFTREKQRKKGGSMFDLEGVDDEEDGLTHMGRALDFEGVPGPKDDFDAGSISGSDEGSDGGDNLLKRRRPSVDEDGEEEDSRSAEEEGEDRQPARKKTKAEVMKEVMAKSKLYKYERQKAKEDDDDLREELDKGMSDMLALLHGYKPPPPKPVHSQTNGVPPMNPDRLAMLNGVPREKADKEYDARLKQLAMDARAAPADRTKTDEEKAAEEAQRLKDLEMSRLRRMRGEEVEEEEKPGKKRKSADEDEDDAVLDEDEMRDDAAEFGLSGYQPERKPLVLEDEDEFEMEDDLVASGSDVDDVSSEAGVSESGSSDGEEGQDQLEEEEDEFVRGILNRGEAATGANAVSKVSLSVDSSKGLAFAYACPRSHAELLAIVKDLPPKEIPTVVQRIRALYHPSLSAENKEKLGDFSVALVDHISYMAAQKQPLQVVETIIRHLHSLSRTYPEKIATAFRTHLDQFHQRGSPTAGDFMIFTAIGSIYPTSDHFHQVVTPAITIMARWLEMTTPSTPSLQTTGAFLVSLCLQYQRLSKRYVPEAARFTLKCLQLRPAPSATQLRLHIDNLTTMTDLWVSKSAFAQIFAPHFLLALKALNQTKAAKHLTILLQQSRLRQRPLELHHHRPLAIRASFPKFEEGFNPDKHYDPDRERAEASKLKAEYKREKKGAVRELRKDANFMAREQLREKRERDAEYEKKYKRLVAEIQGEEGHEAKEYEREKRLRKGKR